LIAVTFGYSLARESYINTLCICGEVVVGIFVEELVGGLGMGHCMYSRVIIINNRIISDIAI